MNLNWEKEAIKFHGKEMYKILKPLMMFKECNNCGVRFREWKYAEDCSHKCFVASWFAQNNTKGHGDEKA